MSITTSRRRVGAPMPLTDLLGLQATGLAGWALAAPLQVPGWWAGLGGFAVGLIMVLPLAGRSLPRRATAYAVFWWDRRRRVRTAASTPFDFELPSGDSLGLSWDGRVLTSLIRVDDTEPRLDVLVPGGVMAPEVLPTRVLVDCLSMFDVALASVDVISQGARSTGHGRVAAVYEAVLGPLPAIAKRSVYVVVRLDPARCRDAVLARGGGWDGALRTAAVATRRVTTRLREAGVRASATTASGMAQAARELTGGLGLDEVREEWSACYAGRVRSSSYEIGPDALDTDGLARVWATANGTTTVTLSLRPEVGGDGIEIRGLVRSDAPNVGATRRGGGHGLPGRQFDALTCSLPLSPPRREVGRWVVLRGDDVAAVPAGLVVPTAGCGQVVGADEHGRAVALTVFGPQVARVEIQGTLHLAQQVVLRSIALGARVRVHTRRTSAWRQMVEAVGDASQLHVVGSDRGAIEADARRTFSVEMFDGEPEQPVRAGVTAVVVDAAGETSSATANVRLQILDQDSDEVLVSTRRGAVRVTMVASEDEMRYTGASYDVAGQDQLESNRLIGRER